MKYRPTILRVRLLREPGTARREVVADSAVAARIARSAIGRQPREHLVGLLLDAKRRLIGVERVGVGTALAALIHPREVFQAAILANAAEIIIAHNHPSGDQSPSREDAASTRRLLRAGRIMGIHLVDHIVLGASSYYSFADCGALR